MHRIMSVRLMSLDQNSRLENNLDLNQHICESFHTICLSGPPIEPVRSIRSSTSWKSTKHWQVGSLQRQVAFLLCFFYIKMWWGYLHSSKQWCWDRCLNSKLKHSNIWIVTGEGLLNYFIVRFGSLLIQRNIRGPGNCELYIKQVQENCLYFWLLMYEPFSSTVVHYVLVMSGNGVFIIYD